MESSLAGGDSMIFTCLQKSDVLDFFLFLRLLVLFKDFESHVKDCGVIEHNDAPVGAWLNVYPHVNASVVIRPAKVVSNCLNTKV